jgi:hypothetical protein
MTELEKIVDEAITDLVNARAAYFTASRLQNENPQLQGNPYLTEVNLGDEQFIP